MIRRASSAASSGTAMRTSPSGLTDIGRIACGLPLIRKAAMPWLSSNASTTLASMSEVVLKTMTGGMCTKSMVFQSPVARTLKVRATGVRATHLEEHQGEVVVQARAADKRADLPQDALAQLLERQVGVFFDQRGQTLFTE